MTVFLWTISLLLPLFAGPVPMQGSFLAPVTETDSLRVADPVRYGFKLESVAPGTALGLPELQFPKGEGAPEIELLRPWKIDTLRVRPDKTLDLEATVVLAPFDEGVFEFPELPVARLSADKTQLDTLLFPPVRLEVVPLPVDTATFQVHDLKGPIRYPLTFKEVLPWLGGGLLAAALLALAVWLIRRRLLRKRAGGAPAVPADVAALRALERYREEKHWEPARQKAFYSGVTDILRGYIKARYGIGAPEMTTAELFDALGRTDAPEASRAELRTLFERADFVKFAKYVADREENAGVLPTAVRFVTATCELPEEAPDGKEGGEA